VLQSCAAFWSVRVCTVLQHVAVCCSALQYVAVCCHLPSVCVATMLQCVAPISSESVCCSVLQCVIVCCSLLQCVAVCYYLPVLRVSVPTCVYLSVCPHCVCVCVCVCVFVCVVVCVYIDVSVAHSDVAAISVFTPLLPFFCVCRCRSMYIGIVTLRPRYNTLQHTATHCNTLQHTATCCTTLHHIATHCNTGTDSVSGSGRGSPQTRSTHCGCGWLVVV